MKRSSQSACFFLWIFVASGIASCDTEKNIENPDKDYFVKYYGGDGEQQGVDMALLEDGSFLLLGNYSVSASEKDIYLTRVDAEGKTVWEKRLGREHNNNNILTAKDLEPTNDGNFVILADFQNGIGDSTDVILLKVSSDGVLSGDSAHVGTKLNDFGRSVTLLSDGGFIVSGTTEFTSNPQTGDNPDPDLGDIFNYRFDKNLDLDPVWGPIFIGFGSHLDVAVKTFQVLDTVFYNFGYTNSVISGLLNPNEKKGLFYYARNGSGSRGDIYYPGNIVNVNDTEIQFAQQVAPALGTGYMVVGTSQNSIGVSEMFFARIRSSLTFESLTNDATLYTTIPLGGRNVSGVSAASSTVDAVGYLLLGNEVRTTGATNIWLTKIDQSGSVLWSSTLGSETEIDTGAAVMELPDGRIAILGTIGLADNQSKMALIKLNSSGQLLK
jgi:hypothetical protein